MSHRGGGSGGGGKVIHLSRDGHDQPWGFRIQGGSDIGTPLKIQRVVIGTPAEGELHSGDFVTRIGQYDTLKLTHQQATDIIKRAGNEISLVVSRSGHAPKPTSPVVQPSPQPMVNSHPLKGAIPTPFAAAQVTSQSLPQRPSKKKAAPQTPPAPSGQRYQQALARPVETLPHTNEGETSEESGNPQIQTSDDDYEKLLITHQPYRTTQLVFPTAKIRKDFSSGTSTYLHQYNPLIQSFSHPEDQNKEVELKQKIADTIVERAAPLSPGQEASKQQVVHKQYNSPLPLYSKENIEETIHDQTGVTPGRGRIVIPGSRRKAHSRAPPASQTSTRQHAPPASQTATRQHAPPASQTATRPHAAPPIPHAPPKASAKHYDPRQSATFQALQELEHGLPTGEQKPIEQKVYNMKKMDPRQHQTFKLAERPLRYEGNAVGITEENIPQSNSFKRLMAEVIGETDF